MSMGMLTINTNGSMPTVSFNVSGGKLPEVKTGTVSVGTTNTTVAVPSVEMTNTTVTLDINAQDVALKRDLYPDWRTTTP